PIPNLSHQTASLLNWNKAWAEAKGTPFAADVRRQAALLEKPLKRGKDVVFAGGGESFAGQQITAGMIGNGQRIAVLTIAQQELALVIGAPQFVGTLA